MERLLDTQASWTEILFAPTHPFQAINKIGDLEGWDLIELNEAFAAQVLAEDMNSPTGLGLNKVTSTAARSRWGSLGLSVRLY